MASLEHLLFRRQFVAGVGDVDAPGDWICSKIAGWLIRSHPELSIAKHQSESRAFLLLGDVFDAEEPALSNGEILHRLASSAESFQDFERLIKRLNGRWVCFAAIRDALRLYLDAGGSHTAFYAQRENDPRPEYVATQPGLLTAYCGIRKDPEIIRAADTSHWLGWWPGELTPYKRVKKLLANHYLNLDSGGAVRWWPTSQIERRDLRDAARLIVDRIKGTIDAVILRSKVYLSLTGGWDSRMLAACCDLRRPEINFLNRQFPLMDDYDAAVPAKLAADAAGAMKVLRVDDKDFNADLLEVYKKNTGYMLWHELSVIHTANRHLEDDCYLLQGHGGESFRRAIGESAFRKLHSREGGVTAVDYARFSGFDTPILVDALQRWCDRELTANTGYPPDLVDNEYLSGSWSSMVCTAANTFSRAFSPFNSVEIIETGLGVALDHRMSSNDLSRSICEVGNPAVLRHPVNESWRTAAKDWLSTSAQILPWRMRRKASGMIKRIGWSLYGAKRHYDVIRDYPPRVDDFMRNVP